MTSSCLTNPTPAAPAAPAPSTRPPWRRSASWGLVRTALHVDEIPTLPRVVLGEARLYVERRIALLGDTDRTSRPRWLWSPEQAIHRLAFFKLLALVFEDLKPVPLARREGEDEGILPRNIERMDWVYQDMPGKMPGDDPLSEFALVLWAHLTEVPGVELELFISTEVDGAALEELARAAWEQRQAAAAPLPKVKAPGRFTVIPAERPGGYGLAIDGELYEPGHAFVFGGVGIKTLCPMRLEPRHWLACALDRLNRPEAGLVMEVRRVPPEAGPLADVLGRTVWINGRPFCFPGAERMGQFIALLVTRAELPSAPALLASGSRVVVRGADKAGRFLLVEDHANTFYLCRASAPDVPLIQLGPQQWSGMVMRWQALLDVLDNIDRDYRVDLQMWRLVPQTAGFTGSRLKVQAEPGGDEVVFDLDTQSGGAVALMLLKRLSGAVYGRDLAAMPVTAGPVSSIYGRAIVAVFPEWFTGSCEAGVSLSALGEAVLADLQAKGPNWRVSEVYGG